MEKQSKVINKIKNSINNGNTTPVGTVPNDECYTGMQSILNELSYWASLGKFKNKNIICPCDCDIVEGTNIYAIKIDYSNTLMSDKNCIYKHPKVEYQIVDLGFNTENTQKNSLESSSEFVVLKENEVESFLRDKITCNFIRVLSQKAKEWGIKSITASGYNPAIGKGIKFQDVDYSNYDICITNPPFSLYAEFMDCILGKIDFICLAPFLNRVTPNVGLPLMLKKCYLGFNRQIHLTFDNPTIENQFNTKIINVDWITSWSDAQDEINNSNYHSTIDYELYKDDYMEMPNMTMKDGTHPIRVPGTQFPYNYDGWMFSSISVLDKLNQNMYEWYGTNFKKYFNTINCESNPFMHKVSNRMTMKSDGIKSFHGIVFRKKP